MINVKQIEQINERRRSLNSLSLKRRKSAISTIDYNNHRHYNQQNVVIVSREVRVVDAKKKFTNLKLGKDYEINRNARDKRSFSEALIQKDNVIKSSKNNLLLVPKNKRTNRLLPNISQKPKTTLTIKDPPKSRTLKLSRFNTKQQQPTTLFSPPLPHPNPNPITNLQHPPKPQIPLYKLYSKASSDYNKQQKLWDYHLKQQLSLQQAIQELQKIELDRNLHPSRKLTMRQAYQLKKEIVSQIEKELSAELIRGNIERLGEIAIDEKERDKCFTIGVFVTLRQSLRSLTPTSSSQFTFSPTVIDSLKYHLPQCPSRNTQQPNIITTKIFSILSLHIMKLQSPKFTLQDVKLINQTIEMKIKVHAVIDYYSSEEKRERHLQGMIYMIYQFYKILFYHKLDEDLKTRQYALLQAYLTLYRQTNPSKYNLFEQNYHIAQTISIIKPLTVDIYPYQDTRGRNEANQVMLKYQMRNPDRVVEDNNTIVRVKRLENNMRSGVFRGNGEVLDESCKQQQSSESYYNEHTTALQQHQKHQQSNNQQTHIENNSLTKLSTIIPNKSRSILKTNPKLDIAKDLIGRATERVLKIPLSKRYESIYFNEEHQQQQQQNLDVEQLEYVINIKRFNFPFLFMKQSQMYHGHFDITLSQQPQPKTVNLHIHVTDPNGFYLTLFNCNGIRTFNQQLTKQNFQKIVWKIFKKVFITGYMQQQDPFLMKQPINDVEHVQKHFPIDCQDLEDWQIVEILHAYIVYWLRMREFCYGFNGKVLVRPEFQLVEVNKYIQYLEYERDRKLFQKRQGFLVPSSGRRSSLLPTKVNSNCNLYFNSILKDFTTTIPSDPQSQPLNIFSLTKLTQFQKFQFNYLHLVFYKHLRQMNIFQFGTFKHILTHTINDKIKVIRKMTICQRHSKRKLIQCIEKALSYNANINSHQKYRLVNNNNRLARSNDVNDIDGYQKYRVEQEFQIDLTNQFKFIPSLNVKIIRKLRCDGEQVQRGRKKRKSKQTTKPASFKVDNRVFLTFAQQFPWGRKLSSLSKCLQFFHLYNPNNLHYFSYSLQSISVYRIGIVLDHKIRQFITQDGKQYNFYNVKKPFLSKAQTQPQTLSEEDKFSSGQLRNVLAANNKINQSQMKAHENPIHFLESRIFFTLKYQRILKFRMINNSIKYYSFQVYQSIQDQDIYSLSQEYNKSQQVVFIYQLTNLSQPHIKSYLLTTKTITQTDSQHITSLIDIKQNTLMGDYMQLFTLPINRVTFTNEFNQSRTKNVRKKVVSEANQYFQQKVLQADSKLGMETLMLNILQRYHGKAGAGHKMMNYEIDDNDDNGDEFNQQYYEQQKRKQSLEEEFWLEQ